MKIQRFKDPECLPCGIFTAPALWNAYHISLEWSYSTRAKLFLRGRQQARKLVNMVYEAIRSSKSFQSDYRLKDQSTGAAISVMGNIPEGFVRWSNREFTQFLFISVSSAAELQSHIYVALDQHYIARETFNKIYQQAEKTSKIISGLITCLRRNEKTSKHKKLNKPDKPNKQNRPNQPDKGRIEKDDWMV